MRRAAAHFLLLPELSRSPPNEAIVSAYLELGFDVDIYATGDCSLAAYGSRVRARRFDYGRNWIARNIWRPGWRRYSAFSGTSEDPLGIAGMLSLVHRRPMIALADEIKSGDYAGDAAPAWKRLCRHAMRRASLNIVNDAARVPLQRDYAGLRPEQPVVVFPGGYRAPPQPVDRIEQRRIWGLPADSLVIGASGGFNLTGGADWLIEAMRKPDLHAVIQPLGVDPFARFLLGQVKGSERIYVEPRRLEWHEAWSQAAALDIGIAVYLRKSDQFQLMGTSSNRLCMFLAMGVPVIASRQRSFEFLEQYDCGVMVDDSAGFAAAIEKIQTRLPLMKVNARRCWADYIDTPRRYLELVEAMRRALQLVSPVGLQRAGH